jgi:hypothetical protein
MWITTNQPTLFGRGQIILLVLPKDSVVSEWSPDKPTKECIKMSESYLTCPKCLHFSGDSWDQCNKSCPMIGSPAFSIEEKNKWKTEVMMSGEEVERLFARRQNIKSILHLLKITNESDIFSENQIKKIEKSKSAKFVIDTEKEGNPVAIFYGSEAHPDSGSRYFGLYWNYDWLESSNPRLMITNGSFVEDLEITGAISNENEVIFSRHRHDYVKSRDDSVFIDGGRDYIRSNSGNTVRMIVRDGILKIADPLEA